MPKKSWLEDATVKQWFRNLSERTKKNYREQFPKWLDFVNESPSKIIENRRQHEKSNKPEVKRFYEDKLIAFKNSLQGKDMKIPTVRSYLRTVMSFFSQNHYPLRFARKELKVEPSAKDKVVREWIPEREEIRILYRSAENSRDRALLLLLYQSGFSEIDVASMKIEDFSFYDSNGKWQLAEEDVYHARLREKTNELQQTCISRETIAEIRLMLQNRGYPKEGCLFVSFRGEQLGVRGINEAIKSIVTKAFNGRVKEWQTKHLRDAYMNALQQAKIPTELKDAMVGHKREGAKASYGITQQTIKQLYAEAFPYLTVNGFASQDRKIEELQAKMNEDKQALTDLITEQQKQIKQLEDTIAIKIHEGIIAVLKKFGFKVETETDTNEDKQQKT